MTFDEQRASAAQKNSGPLERVRFARDESGEKSLLDLIEERSVGRSPGEPSNNRNNFFSTDIDETDDGNQPEFDQMILRLGGNGF